MTATLASLGFDIKTAPIKGATKDLGRMETASKSVSKSLSAMTAVFGLAAVAAGGLSFSRLISESTNFDTSMRKLQATSRATRDEMKALEEQARTLGATTMFSAKETADAQQFLAMAGFSVNKIIGATPAVLKLATAASMDLASAADIASNVLGGMGYQVDELDRVLDTLAATASGSNTSIQQLGQALSFAAPVAVSAGLSIEQTAAAIGVLSDSGLQGSRAGTGLVGVIRSLSRVTPIAEAALATYGLSVEDVNIKAHGLSVVLDRLKEASIETGDTFKIFGSEAGTAANLLAKGAGRVSEFTTELNEASGAAEDMADIIGSGLSGTWAAFNSAVSESVLQLGRSGGVASALEMVTKEATGVISVYNGMTKEFATANDLSDEQISNLKDTAAAWKAVGFAVGGMAAVYLATSTATGIATVAQLAFNAAAMVNPYVFIAASIVAAAAAIYSFTSAQETALATWEKAKGSEAAYNAASSSISAQNQLTKIVNDRIKAQEKLNALEEKGYKKYGSDGNKAIALRREINDLTEKYHTITNARIEATKAQNDRIAAQEAEKAKSLEQQAALQKQMQDAQEAAAARELTLLEQLNTQRLNSIYGRVDPIQAEIIAYTELSATIQEVVKDEKEAARLQNLAAQQYVKNIKRINESASESVKKDLYKGVEAQSQRVADSLQNAITTGDWAGIGATVGATLASGVASAVAAKFAGESMIAMIGAPMLGALAGGLAGLAASKIGGLFSSSYVDPTAERQRTQGTGTVLGSIDAKSESIANATDIAAKASHELIGINRGMLRALESMQSGIEGASTRIAMAGTPDFNIQEMVHNLTDKNFGAKLVGGMNDTIGSIVTLGLYNNLGKDLGKLLGGKTKLTDSGINIGGGAIGGLGGDIAAYQGSKSKSYAWSSYSNNADVTAQIDADAKRQFGLVYESIIDTIAESGKVFGITEQEIRKVNVAAQKLSLKGLSADQQQKELEAYFSKVFDTTTAAVFGWLNDPKLAKAGEGLGETMVRVATNIQTAEEAARQLGFTMGGVVKEELALASQTLIEAMGGVDQFASSMKSFISTFATEAQQFEINQGALNRALADAKLPLANSRAGYWELMQAQDASTEKGAQNIATLLRLQGAADSYYSTLEKKAAEAASAAEAHNNKLLDYSAALQQAREEDARDAISKQQAIASAQLSAQNSVLQAAVSNASAVNQALGGLNTQDTASSRESALASIREMTRTGNIGDDLQSTLSSATAINAADFATFNDYVRTVARTGEALGGLKGVTDAKVTREQELLAGIERRIEAMAEELALIGKSNAKHTSKTAAILERMELDGIELREVENA